MASDNRPRAKCRELESANAELRMLRRRLEAGAVAGPLYQVMVEDVDTVRVCPPQQDRQLGLNQFSYMREDFGSGMVKVSFAEGRGLEGDLVRPRPPFGLEAEVVARDRDQAAGPPTVWLLRWPSQPSQWPTKPIHHEPFISNSRCTFDLKPGVVPIPEEATEIVKSEAANDTFDLVLHLYRQSAWSLRTFGPGAHTDGIVDHILLELQEITAVPGDLEEWIDVVILALDGALRAGHTPQEVAAALDAKQRKNETRQWPDWRTSEPGKAIEHIKGNGAP